MFVCNLFEVNFYCGFAEALTRDPKLRKKKNPSKIRTREILQWMNTYPVRLKAGVRNPKFHMGVP